MADNDQIRTAEFLTTSVLDMQATIRAIDFKGYVILLLLSLPFSKIEVIQGGVAAMCNAHSSIVSMLAYILAVIALLAWIAAFAFALRCLIVVVDPSKRVAKDEATEDNPKTAQGLFFAARRFKYSWRNALYDANVRTDASPRSVLKEFADSAPLEQELAFEQLKLGFILARKIACTRYATIATGCWSSAGVALWVVAVIHRIVP